MPKYKIHPAIGIARVGNSETHFIGPEKPFTPPDLGGGTFKDKECRIKRQAARFRIFEYPDAPAPGQPAPDPIEVDCSAANVTVVWRVGPPSAAEHHVSGKNAQTDVTRSFKPTFMGELRTDDECRLLVLGGYGAVEFISAGSTFGGDDTWDGYVHADLQIDGEAQTVTPAWVVVAPPKYAPPLESVVTLWDLTESRLLGNAPVPTPVLYSQHIYPILHRAQSVRFVMQTGAGHHTWDLTNVGSLPRDDIFESLTPPSGVNPPADPTPQTVPSHSMPKIKDLTLTRLQYLRMQAFWSGTGFVDDGGHGPVPTAGDPTADELDRAALEACDGGPFKAGVEVSGVFKDPATFDAAEPKRVDQSHGPGYLRDAAGFALEKPWQRDILFACRTVWPMTAPLDVLRKLGAGGATYEPWLNSVTGVPDQATMKTWPQLGFVVRDTSGADEIYVKQECVKPHKTETPSHLRDRLFKAIDDVIHIVDPSPVDLGRFFRELGRPGEVEDNRDDLSRLLHDVDRLDAGRLRVELVGLRSKIARLKAASRLVEGKLKKKKKKTTPKKKGAARGKKAAPRKSGH